jgi:hypothetical protein
MTHDQFIETIASDRPPGDLSETLTSLWWDKKGYYDRAIRWPNRLPPFRAAPFMPICTAKRGASGMQIFSTAGRVKSNPIRRLRWSGGPMWRRCQRYDN